MMVRLAESAHLVEPNHGPEFWRVVAGIMGDFSQRKEWLAARGHGWLWTISL